MKSNLLFGLLFLVQTLSAQTFTEVPQFPPIEGLVDCSVAFADVDGDNDQDLLIAGETTSFERTTKLYLNDGAGNFTEATNTPFEGVFFSDIAFADVDGDNDQDLFITGMNFIGLPIAKLYINDGAGNFAEATGPSFYGVMWSSAAFADVDGDNDQDVLISGRNIFSGLATKLYLNDGDGNFAEVAGTSFPAVDKSRIAFSDVDGDNDQDFFIAGNDSLSLFEGIKKLYLNDGAGNFTEDTSTYFDGFDDVYSIAFADVDNDNDQDLFLTGYKGFGPPLSRLYINDGAGNFTEATGPGASFEGVFRSDMAFADVDGDNNQDVLIAGVKTGGGTVANLYINDGVTNSTSNFTSEFILDFTTYPNPAKSDILNISFNSSESGVSTTNIYDVKGRLLVEQRAVVGIGEQDISVNIASLAPGSYLIQLENGHRRGVASFMVQ
ncbi:T9SS type A sorting domain-containing protein [Phaeodactylibacter sp.]|uniref:T9SS type A sorting domain-containing protein n=1 Tax=Phaeodactylibacter sp. TaxID=1940289 RepID=UPI0025D609BF|nr:T9SS type A sorting domain-containing protein [Phaeodactylibacter sp.]MCI4648404.1 T9SS type A sorting domain-containing protein [Phaeodactylibacter sp.]MCI5091097.1 T9SS type A sorting domain-containing protein [Phaeodactylibacter sp.]